MSRAKEKSWAEITLDGWLLGAEASMVVALRGARLARGGQAACDEAQLMVSEKLASGQELAAALVAGKLGKSPKAVIGNTLAHYLKGVRANRKRLAKT